MQFWEFIEEAWSAIPELKGRRSELAQVRGEKEPNQLAKTLESAIRDFVYPELEKHLLQMSKDEYSQFLGILKKRLTELDKKEIYKYVDGSDDGFLYSRGFIIGMGRDYFHAILNDPSLGTLYLESEEFGYFIQHLFDKRFNLEYIDPLFTAVPQKASSKRPRSIHDIILFTIRKPKD